MWGRSSKATAVVCQNGHMIECSCRVVKDKRKQKETEHGEISVDFVSNCDGLDQRY